MSRSRAADSVPTCASNSPDFSRHPFASCSVMALSVCCPSGVERSTSVSMILASSASLTQSTAVEEPTPRGSKPTMSYLFRTAALKASEALAAKSIPDPPGPPGLTNRVPIGLPLLAGTFIMAMVIVLPPGFL